MSRRGRSVGKPPGGPWYGELRQRLAFERGFCDSPGRSGRMSRYRGKACYTYRLPVEVPTYGVRQVTISFDRKAPNMPRVFADGPCLSRHRFEDESLCMWYQKDPPERRWLFNEGLCLLVGHIKIHLFKESWFVDTGEWLGDEIRHRPEPVAS